MKPSELRVLLETAMGQAFALTEADQRLTEASFEQVADTIAAVLCEAKERVADEYQEHED